MKGEKMKERKDEILNRRREGSSRNWRTWKVSDLEVTQAREDPEFQVQEKKKMD